MNRHTVVQGDSLSSIAAAFGANWKTVWSHADNAPLRARRKDPNVLYPGDVVIIPEKETRLEHGASDARHRFVRKGVPDKLEIRLLKDFKVRAHVAYSLVVDSKTTPGTTDADGWVRAWISPLARDVRLVLEGGKEEYVLALGHVDPIDTISGVQARLCNLGFFSAAVTGELNNDTRDALSAFQRANGVPATGEADAATMHQLEKEYGC